MVKRNTAMQPRDKGIIEELYVNLIGCAWIAACVALYFLVTAIFYQGSWWDFFGSVAISALLILVRCTANPKRNALRRIASDCPLASHTFSLPGIFSTPMVKGIDVRPLSKLIGVE
jgi:hypothetical protein